MSKQKIIAASFDIRRIISHSFRDEFEYECQSEFYYSAVSEKYL